MRRLSCKPRISLRSIRAAKTQAVWQLNTEQRALAKRLRVIARHSRSKKGVASLAYGDEAIQRAQSAARKRSSDRKLGAFFARLPARSWIASLRSQ
jgi:hypothetical protein